MSKKDNVNKIKSYIDDILGTKSSLKEKLPSKISYKKELFCNMLRDLQFANDRTMGMKHDYKINMMQYDDPFYTAIESLIKLQFNQEQRQTNLIKIYDHISLLLLQKMFWTGILKEK